MKVYCTDCRHRLWHPTFYHDVRCLHPDARRLTGEYLTIEQSRYDGPCTEAGLLFEQKPEPPAPPPPPPTRKLEFMRPKSWWRAWS